MDALTPQQRCAAGLSELDRIETDPEPGALFFAELDAVIAERIAAEVAELEAFTDAVEVAAEMLQAVTRPNGERAA
ncbi:hypothetical protein ACWDZ4_03010 [Streptomyces sp. NPDC003016]